MREIDKHINREALEFYMPKVPDLGYASTIYTPELFAKCCYYYANGLTEREIGKKFGIPPSLLWRWASIPGLQEMWAQARKDHSYCVIMEAEQAFKTLTEGQRTDPHSGQQRALDKNAAACLDRGGRLAMEICAKLNPDEFSDRLQLDKRSVSAVYVVSYQSQGQIGQEPTGGDVLSVPAPDKAGVERAKLAQNWRTQIAKERRAKLTHQAAVTPEVLE